MNWTIIVFSSFSALYWFLDKYWKLPYPLLKINSQVKILSLKNFAIGPNFVQKEIVQSINEEFEISWKNEKKTQTNCVDINL